MKTFIVPTEDQVAPEAKATFEMFKKTAGKVPNLYATIGYSANALNSYMAFVQAQAKGSFHAKEREAIYLIVSQLNNCPYCLAAHTAGAIRNGWKEEETLLLRSGKFTAAPWPVFYNVIQSVIENKGDVKPEILEQFFNQGHTEAQLMDIMVLISVMSFTNYVYRMIKVPIDYPAAKSV